MTDKRNSSRWLFAGIVLVLVFAVGSIVGSSLLLRTRQLEIADMALVRAQQMLRIRLDGMFQDLDQDLLMEAAAIHEMVLNDTSFLRERWRPLFTANAAIMAVRLATERGDEVSMSRGTNGPELSVHMNTAYPVPEIVLDALDTIGTNVDKGPEPFDPVSDPRASLWFSKALEGTLSAPVWNLVRPEPAREPLLQLSQLIRHVDPRVPYRILMFEVDLRRSSWVDTRSSPLHHYGVVLHDGDGVPLNIPDALKDPSILEAEEMALTHWSGTKTRSPFPIVRGDRSFMALDSPYLLNGETLYGTTLVDVAMIAKWTAPERIALIIASVLVVLLIALLSISWIRRRKETEDIRRQARRSETQELKLAKALGEREVLNREVHHRVKNNLQVVSSLLNLQVSRMDDDTVRAEFLRGKRRIDNIALVHHKLYGLKDLRNVDLHLFFEGLIEAIRMMYHPGSERVSCDLQTHDIRVDQDTAIELGIILCELLGNTFQHAFPYATGGHVDLVVQPVEGDLYRMVIKDNGKGLPDGYSDGPGKLGLEIVEALSEQLDGSFHTRVNGGTICEVLFRVRHEPPLLALSES